MNSRFLSMRSRFGFAVSKSFAVCSIAPLKAARQFAVWITLGICLVFNGMHGVAQDATTSEGSTGSKKLIDFERDVAPTLREHCLKCHHGERAKADFQIADRDALLGYIELETFPIVHCGLTT